MRIARRKAVWTLLTVAFLAGLIAADRVGVFGRRPLPDEAKYDGVAFHVVRVVDGDTIDVDMPDGKYPHTRIRLWGVDTPETVKPDTPVHHFGPEASRFTKQACYGKQVTLRLERRDLRDKYGRLLAYVILPDGRMLNRILIEEGCGYADPRFEHTHQREFRKAQDAARAAGRGLWKDVTDADLPYYYRGKLALD
jgi:endonuclease YncB( thermonuclease family)